MEQNFDCVPCGFTSTNRYNYDIHVRTVKHKARMEGLKCEQCGALYDSRNKLTRHMKNVHVKKEKRISEYLSAVAATENKDTPDSTLDSSVKGVQETISSGEADTTSNSLLPLNTSTNAPIIKPIITKKAPKINIRPKLAVRQTGASVGENTEVSATKMKLNIIPKK